MKFFAHYTVVNGKIKTLKTMTWKPETGVTKAPRLGDEAGQRAAFMAYTRAFSGALPEKYSAFYTDDVKLHLSTVGQLDGKKAIVDFYTKMFRTVREDLEIRQIVFDEHAIVGDFVSVFTADESHGLMPGLQHLVARDLDLNIQHARMLREIREVEGARCRVRDPGIGPRRSNKT